ncbi:MAG: GC-type dockerin domain-anchored protein, partial [Phycisphaerales bacterium JB041]
FLNAWTKNDPRADYNDDGDINTLDVLAFLNVWAAGCT